MSIFAFMNLIGPLKIFKLSESEMNQNESP